MLAKKLLTLAALGALVLSGCAPGEQYQPKPSESPTPGSTETQTNSEPPPLENASYRQIKLQPAGNNNGVPFYQTLVKLEDGTVVNCISQTTSRMMGDETRGTSISCDWENARRPSNPTETPTP